MSLPDKLQAAVSEHLGQKIRASQPVSGGCISHTELLDLESGKLVFLKWNSDAPEGLFSSEAEGLKALSATEAIRIPQVLAVSEQGPGVPAFIALEALTPGSKDAEASEKLGRQLAALHRNSAEKFGYEVDNFIGSMPQKNAHADDWGAFFFEMRLRPQAEFGSEAGWFDKNFDRLLSKKRDKIIDILNAEAEAPALLHGDLWSGNVFWSAEGPALIDPAVYYGSREADIAFSEMFGGFSSSFYSAYKEEFPLKPGYEKRKEILNLYHYMNHANLFGAGYISSAYSVLTRI